MTLEERILDLCKKKSSSIAIAESCTGGYISSRICALRGASAFFWGSFVCYSIDAKEKMLGIDPVIIKTYGAVSRETVLCMAERALSAAATDYALAISGLLGPDGDTSIVPVGSVWIAVAAADGSLKTSHSVYSGNRMENRNRASDDALKLLYDSIT